LIAVSVFSVNSIMLTQAQLTSSASACKVEILGGSPIMYPAQHVSLAANITGGEAKNYTWTVEGNIVKDYDDNVYNSTYLTSYLNIDPPTFMSPADYHQPSITFYWGKPNGTDTTRTVSLKVQTANKSMCEDTKEFIVTKNNDNIDLQAEDFMVEQNHPVGLTPDGRVTTRILQQHQQWHADQDRLGPKYSDRGDDFFYFHRSYIGHFDAARNLFGYNMIEPWPDPGNSSLPTGIEVNHVNRRINATNPYMPEELPPWFKNQPGSEGKENRSIIFARSFPGQDQLPPGHPLANSGLKIEFDEDSPYPPNSRYAFLNGHTEPMCEEMDYPKSSSGYPLVQNSLSDFEPDMRLLGCALTYPYHDGRHGAIGRDMGSTLHAPRDPIFWKLHKFLDNVAALRFLPSTAGIALRAIDSDPPQIIFQNPFALYPYLTSLPTISENEKGIFGMSGVEAISAQFSEPVIGIQPSDFRVNGSPATQVSGTGAGPYVFIGFKSPGIGPVNATLAAGNITDVAGNPFEGSSWEYILVDPNFDKDTDGLKDELEVNLMRTSPFTLDSDGDSIPDGIEATTKCLNPIVNDAEDMDISMTMGLINETTGTGVDMTMGLINETTGTDIINETSLDLDRDNKTNVQEFQMKTDPCSSSKSFDDNIANMVGGISMVDNSTITLPFTLTIKKSGGPVGTSSDLQYDSFNKTSVSIMNGTKSTRQLSSADEILAKRILNDSGFFDSKSFYPPALDNEDSFEYTLSATLNGKSHAIYWTDASEGVPNGIRNLPFIMSYVLGPRE
jgi:hypothetical protein